MESVRIRVAEPPAENVDGYYKRIQERFERGIITQHLQFRADAGSNRSERGYQKIAASTCGRIARVLGCSEDRAKVLCQAQRYEEAGFWLEDMLEEYPEIDDVYLMMSDVKFFMEDYDAAMEGYELIIEKDAENEWA